MLILLSPAKILNEKLQMSHLNCSSPSFLDSAVNIVEAMRELSVQELSTLLKTNLKIATQNSERLIQWDENHYSDNAKPALWFYNGAVFSGIDPALFSESDVKFSENRLRILSGLYGILRPTDLIMPYRLDISTTIPNKNIGNLYKFWKEKITEHIAQILDNDRTICNLMSGEYAKAVNFKKLNCKVIEFDFLQYQPDSEKLKSATIYTKRARGLMTRFIIKNRINNPDELKLFNYEGYLYDDNLSTEHKLTFVKY